MRTIRKGFVKSEIVAKAGNMAKPSQQETIQNPNGKVLQLNRVNFYGKNVKECCGD